MFFIPLILTAGLDLSLPEFQPEVDLSGNYIIAEYDDVSGDFVVEEVRELPDGLTAAALAQKEESDSGDVIYNRDGSGSDPEDSSGNDPTPDNPSIDFSGVIIELQVLHDELSMKLRIIIFVLIWQFILPLAMKIRDHIFNLKHD